ncbi:uncharacterized protein J8A68_005568 [[Candida] subhashii]|uniref:Uncharacterized protein n=1 Tax=[Candida] subhashii TaxID=561895 RepID=A0A8J5QH25_9ASCO|nr:uncharacterized protein J8A68_005568 [[Candida] subhashii]KAG7660893.1 hypothetical protein J8A68_005568 [[Candida] subhashii]
MRLSTYINLLTLLSFATATYIVLWANLPDQGSNYKTYFGINDDAYLIPVDNIYSAAIFSYAEGNRGRISFTYQEKYKVGYMNGNPFLKIYDTSDTYSSVQTDFYSGLYGEVTVSYYVCEDNAELGNEQSPGCITVESFFVESLTEGQIQEINKYVQESEEENLETGPDNLNTQNGENNDGATDINDEEEDPIHEEPEEESAKSPAEENSTVDNSDTTDTDENSSEGSTLEEPEEESTKSPAEGDSTVNNSDTTDTEENSSDESTLEEPEEESTKSPVGTSSTEDNQETIDTEENSSDDSTLEETEEESTKSPAEEDSTVNNSDTTDTEENSSDESTLEETEKEPSEPLVVISSKVNNPDSIDADAGKENPQEENSTPDVPGREPVSVGVGSTSDVTTGTETVKEESSNQEVKSTAGQVVPEVAPQPEQNDKQEGVEVEKEEETKPDENVDDITIQEENPTNLQDDDSDDDSIFESQVDFQYKTIGQSVYVVSTNLTASKEGSEEPVRFNGTHLTIYDGEVVTFVLEGKYLKVAKDKYVQVNGDGLLLVSTRDKASPVWSVAENSIHYASGGSGSVAAEFNACPQNGYAIFVNVKCNSQQTIAANGPVIVGVSSTATMQAVISDNGSVAFQTIAGKVGILAPSQVETIPSQSNVSAPNQTEDPDLDEIKDAEDQLETGNYVTNRNGDTIKGSTLVTVNIQSAAVTTIPVSTITMTVTKYDKAIGEENIETITTTIYSVSFSASYPAKHQPVIAGGDAAHMTEYLQADVPLEDQPDADHGAFSEDQDGEQVGWYTVRPKSPNVLLIHDKKLVNGAPKLSSSEFNAKLGLLFVFILFI